MRGGQINDLRQVEVERKRGRLALVQAHVDCPRNFETIDTRCNVESPTTEKHVV